MMQKRKLSSLLLISFIVVFSFSFAAANTVDFGTSDQLRCDDAFQAIYKINKDKQLELIYQSEILGTFLHDFEISNENLFIIRQKGFEKRSMTGELIFKSYIEHSMWQNIPEDTNMCLHFLKRIKDKNNVALLILPTVL